MITYERIDENTRVATDGNQKWQVKRLIGIDLWEIKPEKGALPKLLEGRYTDPQRAYSQIENYLATKTKVA